MSDPRKEPEFLLPDLEVPDLELEPVPAQRSNSPRVATPNAPSVPARPNSAAPATATSGLPELDLEAGAGVVLGATPAGDASYFGAASFGGDFDDDGMLDNGASLAVAAEGYDRSRATASVPAASTAALPSGRTPNVDQIEVAAHEVERVAGYGPPPTAFYAAPAYAYRVATRQRALRKSLVQADSELRAAEAERDLRIAEMALGLRPALEQDERFRRLFEPLTGLDRVASDQGEALSQVSSEYEAQAAELQAELEATRTELSQRGLVEQAASQAFVDREANWKRTDAKLKRTNIEIRNLIESNRGAQGQPAPALPPDTTRALAQLNERLAVQKDEATKARAEHDRTQAELSAVRQQVSELQKRARRIEQHQTALAQKYQKRFEAQNQGLTSAETQRIAVLAEIGRAVLDSRGKQPIAPEALGAIAEADRATLEHSRKAAALLRALDAYDRDALKQGRTITAVLAGAAMILIVLKFAL